VFFTQIGGSIIRNSLEQIIYNNPEKKGENLKAGKNVWDWNVAACVNRETINGEWEKTSLG